MGSSECRMKQNFSISVSEWVIHFLANKYERLQIERVRTNCSLNLSTFFILSRFRCILLACNDMYHKQLDSIQRYGKFWLSRTRALAVLSSFSDWQHFVVLRCVVPLQFSVLTVCLHAGWVPLSSTFPLRSTVFWCLFFNFRGMIKPSDMSPRRLSDISPQIRQLKSLVIDEELNEELKSSRSVEYINNASIEERILRITGYYGYEPWNESIRGSTLDLCLCLS